MRTLIDEMVEPSVAGHLFRLILRMSLGEQKNLLEELEKRSSFKKRRHVRKTHFSAVDYVVQDDSHTDFIQNISAGGVFIGTAAPLSAGQEIMLSLPLPVSEDQISVSGEIAWTSEEGIGVKFNPSDSLQEKTIENLVNMI